MVTSFNTNVVLQSLEHSFGWLNPTEAGYNIVDTDNQKSSTQRYFNDDTIHPACNVQYIKDCQPDANISDDNFNKYLRQLRMANVIATISEVMNGQNFMETGFVYETTENFEFRGVNNTGTFVGLRFLLEPGYMVNLPNVMLHFDGDAEFYLYLHNQFVGEVAKWKVSVKANQQYIFPLNHAITYSSSVAKGGVWFLSYDQTELGDVKAIDYGPCRKKFVCMNAMSFMSDRLDVGKFNMTKFSTTTNMYGMNVEVSNYQDVTMKIVQNAHLFHNLIGLNMASKCIDIIVNTSRSNEKERITKELSVHLYREKHNVTTSENPFDGGLNSLIKQEKKRIAGIFFRRPKTKTVNL